jgi:hypothetical protein
MLQQIDPGVLLIVETVPISTESAPDIRSGVRQLTSPANRSSSQSCVA